MRWRWMVDYEQVSARRDYALAGAGAVQDDAGLASAILYGKAALVLQHLEQRLGRQKMRQILSLFVAEHRGMSVGWPQLVQCIRDVEGSEESSQFGLWVDSLGGPDWEFSEIRVEGDRVSGVLGQQSRFPFHGEVEVGILNQHHELLRTQAIEISGRQTVFDIPYAPEGHWLVVDPNFTMPRRSTRDGRPSWMVRI